MVAEHLDGMFKRPDQKSPRLWLRTFVVLVTILLAFGTVWRAGPYTAGGYTLGSARTHSDFTAYLAGGSAVRNGTDIYKAHNQRDWAYVYLPPLAILMVPLTLLPVPVAVLLWFILCVAALRLGIRCCRRLTGAGSGRLDGARALLPVVLALPFIVDGLTRGQASVLVAVAVFGMFYFDSLDQPMRAAGCLAIAALLKVFPLALLPYFMWRRQWRFCGFSVFFMLLGAVLLPACVLGWQATFDYLIEWVHVVGQPALVPGSKGAYFPQLLQPQGLHNQSLYAVLTRISEVAAPASEHYVRVLSDSLSIAAFMLICAVDRRAARTNRVFVRSALVVWLLIAAPVTELHYYILLVLPLFGILYSTRQAALSMRFLSYGLLMLFGLFAICVPILGNGLDAFWFYGGLCLLCLLLLGGLLSMASQRPDQRLITRSDRSALPLAVDRRPADVASAPRSVPPLVA